MRREKIICAYHIGKGTIFRSGFLFSFYHPVVFFYGFLNTQAQGIILAYGNNNLSAELLKTICL